LSQITPLTPLPSQSQSFHPNFDPPTLTTTLRNTRDSNTRKGWILWNETEYDGYGGPRLDHNICCLPHAEAGGSQSTNPFLSLLRIRLSIPQFRPPHLLSAACLARRTSRFTEFTARTLEPFTILERLG